MREGQRLVLVDGSSFFYRSYHASALAKLSNEKGFPTGAMFGVNRTIDQLLRLYPCDYFAIVFDPPGETRRNQWAESYKANRPPTPDDLRKQFEPLVDIIRARGIACVVEPGEEADDVIGTLTRRARKVGVQVCIVTGDKDMAQLVERGVLLVNTVNNKVVEMGSAEVEEKFGVRPDQVAAFLALKGDAVDNISGIPGVGEKTAVRLLRDYQSLDGITAHLDQIGGRVARSIVEHGDQLPLLLRLTTIICDLELDIDLESLRCQPPDRQQLAELYREYGFMASLRALEAEQPAVLQVKRCAMGDMPSFIRGLSRPFWLFAAPTSTHQIAIAVGDGDDQACAICDQRDWEQYSAAVREAISSKWYCHDYKSLLHTLSWEPSTSPPFDVMLASYIVNSSARHDLDALCGRYGVASTTKGLDEGNLEGVADGLGRALPVAYKELDAVISNDANLHRMYHQVEFPLSVVLLAVERVGVAIDEKMLVAFSVELRSRISDLELRAFEQTGEPFNLDSPRQIREILFYRMRLPVLKKTAGGEASTDESVLQELARRGHELAAIIVERRQLSKLRSTYTDALCKHIDARDGRIHCRLNQAVANTGRLSSSRPNLQNIPIRSAEGRRLREAFVAAPGMCLMAADYSQIELRILAHACGDRNMQKAFADGKDIHTETAAELFATAADCVSADQRRCAKAVNFGLIYGMGSFSLANQLGISHEQANQYITVYFDRYPEVQQYMQHNKDFASQNGYVETLFGRRVALPDIRARNAAVRRHAERAAINAPIQGTAADIIKTAMLMVDRELSASSTIRMVLQIHDELLFEVRTEECERWRAVVCACMEKAADLSVPLKVDCGFGSNWSQAH